MTKKTLFITILISLLGSIAVAKPKVTANQDKDRVAAPAQRMQRANQWSNELKAAYEAKDMDKIGKLIEQMDDFKAKMRKANAGKKMQDGQKSRKGERGWKSKNFNKDNDPNDTRMQRPMRQMKGQQFGQRADQGMRSQRGAGYGQGYMQKNFARRGQGMGNQRPYWQGRGRCYQEQKFCGQRQMGRQFRGQNNWQCPMVMQRQGNFRRNNQMARGFGDCQQGQRPMYRGQRGFDRSGWQQKSWGDGQFRGPQKKYQGRNRGNMKMAPAGNEWDW